MWDAPAVVPQAVLHARYSPIVTDVVVTSFDVRFQYPRCRIGLGQGVKGCGNGVRTAAAYSHVCAAENSPPSGSGAFPQNAVHARVFPPFVRGHSFHSQDLGVERAGKYIL